ncbi:MAG TPA: hypothetical protein DCE71_06700 [Parachlamydiales bacterium]|nr:hypothetical protein [Parachlamydiales bacterium]
MRDEFLIPKQFEESVLDKKAPQNFDSERTTIAGGKARVKIEILRQSNAVKNRFFKLFRYKTLFFVSRYR